MRYDDTHCVHGCYIGYPGGPDYLCQYCEDGTTVEELREWAHQDRLADARLLVTAIDTIRDTVPFKASNAYFLIEYVWGEVDRKGLTDEDIAELVGD